MEIKRLAQLDILYVQMEYAELIVEAISIVIMIMFVIVARVVSVQTAMDLMTTALMGWFAIQLEKFVVCARLEQFIIH